MPFAPNTLAAFFSHGHDTVIDVRSPAEFADDHVPGAINLPALDNDERARVGTIYKQESPFKARKIGAALVFANAARHVAGPLSHHDGDWRPLVYCWRGGQRSGSFTWMLREIGWRAEVVEGGYRRFRRLVSDFLYTTRLPYRLIQLGGYTGSAKTEVLARVKALGGQVIDLEGLARHRGSLLGDLADDQPSQKAFETALAHALATMSPDRPILIEAESARIGALNIPPSLWEAMKTAPWIELNVPLDVRAAYLSDAYADVLSDGEALLQRLAPLRYHRGHALVDHWGALHKAGDLQALCKSLAADHYDPAYRKSTTTRTPTVLRHVTADTLDAAAQNALAEVIVETMARVKPPQSDPGDR